MRDSSFSSLFVGFCFRLVARCLFRIRILGPQHIPAEGPALLVSNHLTYLDAFLIGASVRPVVRFMVWQSYYDNPLFRWGFRLAHSIPVRGTPHSIAQSIALARGELRQGHIVCLFAEGCISRSGKLLSFKRGLELIARDLDVPIVPVHLGGLWESVFSFRGGQFFWKRPRHLRHPVAISFGPPMAPSSTAPEVRDAVQELAVSAAERL